MADIHPDIKPDGLSQKDYVDLLYMIVSSIKGIAAKLDADSAVSGTDFEANAYTAIFNIIINDSKGNRTGITGNHIISPTGISDPALIELFYQIFDSIETLTEQLDADGGVADTNYEALVYTANYLWNVTRQNGNTIGNGVAFYFNPSSGMQNQKELVNLLYAIVDSIETLTEKLDADGTVNDTNYEALWFTANITLRVRNGQGNVVGN
jgi:hypothetical protein